MSLNFCPFQASTWRGGGVLREMCVQVKTCMETFASARCAGGCVGGLNCRASRGSYRLRSWRTFFVNVAAKVSEVYRLLAAALVSPLPLGIVMLIVLVGCSRRFEGLGSVNESSWLRRKGRNTLKGGRCVVLRRSLGGELDLLLLELTLKLV